MELEEKAFRAEILGRIKYCQSNSEVLDEVFDVLRAYLAHTSKDEAQGLYEDEIRDLLEPFYTFCKASGSRHFDFDAAAMALKPYLRTPQQPQDTHASKQESEGSEALPVHRIDRNGCSICGTDALHCSAFQGRASKQEAVDEEKLVEVVLANDTFWNNAPKHAAGTLARQAIRSLRPFLHPAAKQIDAPQVKSAASEVGHQLREAMMHLTHAKVFPRDSSVIMEMEHAIEELHTALSSIPKGDAPQVSGEALALIADALGSAPVYVTKDGTWLNLRPDAEQSKGGAMFKIEGLEAEAVRSFGEKVEKAKAALASITEKP